MHRIGISICYLASNNGILTTSNAQCCLVIQWKLLFSVHTENKLFAFELPQSRLTLEFNIKSCLIKIIFWLRYTWLSVNTEDSCRDLQKIPALVLPVILCCNFSDWIIPINMPSIYSNDKQFISRTMRWWIQTKWYSRIDKRWTLIRFYWHLPIFFCDVSKFWAQTIRIADCGNDLMNNALN